MSHFHLKLASYIDMIWVNIAQTASDFHSVNVVTKQQPIANIDMPNYILAVTVAKALTTKVPIAQS